jgi:Ferritin-like
MATDRRIIELLEVEEPARDLDWLKESLQSAVELELATLPVYLSGMWSIKAGSGEVFDLVKSVVMEEMLHLGLTSNMLKAIGGAPKMRVPSYPSPLPGGVRPELTVFLAGLSLDSVAMYMEIEKPEHPLALRAETFPTIGDFYDAILAAFQALSPQLSTTGQQTSNISVPTPSGGSISEPLKKLATLADVEQAIATIKEQGEGTTKSPDAPEFGGELAHYYRFGEIHAGKKLIQVGDEFKFEGDPVPFPDCFPVAKVPPEGYPDLPESQAFDRAFSTLISQLEQAWAGSGSPGSLGQAIGTMFSLADLAAPLVQMSRPSGDGNFGPDFKLV